MVYIIVTPAKNEGEYLCKTIKSITSQTVKPLLWVIVDDGSTDDMPQLIENAKKQFSWIKSIRLVEGKRDLRVHYSVVCSKGFDFAFDYCKKNQINYEYIAIVDADMVLQNNYFENLINEFIDNPHLGIASGGTLVDVKGKNVRLPLRDDLPEGGHRLWRRECFIETGGYPETCAADSVSNIKAKLKGWDAKRFEQYTSFQLRMTSSAEGFWKGWKNQGEFAYYLCAHPTYVIARALKYSFAKPYYFGFAYLVGYLQSYLNRDERTKDEEIRYYYSHTRPREFIKKYL